MSISAINTSNTRKKKIKKSMSFAFFIPLIITFIFTALNLTSFYKMTENKFYDLLLHIKPAVPEDKSILLIDIDDLAISKVGVFPWSRDIMVDGLIVMKEFDAKYAVFDIEYTEKSPLGVNSRLLKEEIPEIFFDEFLNINQNTTDLFDALKTKTISINDAEDFIKDLSGLTEMSKNLLLNKVEEIARDNDIYLGQAAHLFDKAYFTLSMLDEEEYEDYEVEVEDEAAQKELKDLKKWIASNIAIKNILFHAALLPDTHTNLIYTAEDIRPAILPIITQGHGAGFVNVIVDDDGVRRRIDLIREYKGSYFPQLSFSALLDRLGNPDVIILKGWIILKGAEIPGKEKQEKQKKDIAIPLTEDKRMLINWPKKKYKDSFRHMTYWSLILHNRQEKNLIHNLREMNDAGYFSYYEKGSSLLDLYHDAERIKNKALKSSSPQAEAVDDFKKIRILFLQELGAFLTSDVEKNIIEEIDAVLSSEELIEKDKENFRITKNEVIQIFSFTRQIYEKFIETRTILTEKLKDSFCIIGSTGTSTTDIGVNPFEKEYINVGTHASLINTILTGHFLDILPWWYSAILALILSGIIYIIIRSLNPLPSIITGISFIVLIIVSGIAFFLFTGVYMNMLTPALSVFFTFIVLTFLKFLITAKEKAFIKNAFGHYLSTDIINELILNPEKLKLGGEEKHLSALFTDIQGFSSISESLNPTDLVKLLNSYLTEMSNIILNLKGTIDKYEGDAIISFFGAPIEFEDHAKRACIAAIRIKKMEELLNKHFLDDKISPAPILTRIGINTGKMVVGNMGTAKKMDYTIMGNSVNLASRLEGVNKQYGTWLLINESTYAECGNKDFTVRQLDKVRVVGINKSVRLYELIDEKKDTDNNIKEAIEIFHNALKLFEHKEWEKALAIFKKVVKIIPNDGPSNVFIKRCTKYIKKPPRASWDGIFNLSIK